VRGRLRACAACVAAAACAGPASARADSAAASTPRASGAVADDLAPTSEAGPIAADVFDLRLGLAGVVAHETRTATCASLASACGGAPYVERLGLAVFDAPIDLAYGLAPWVAVEARIDVRVIDATSSYAATSGAPIAAPPGVRQADEVQAGPADMWAMLRFAGARGGLVASARLGASIPIGKVEPSAGELAGEGKSTQHVQFGSGTVRPIVGGALAWSAGAATLAATALVVGSLVDDSRGYRAPTEVYAEARGGYALARGALRPYAAVDVEGANAALWYGAPSFEAPGHAELLVGGGVAWRFSESWTLDAGARANVASLTPSAGFSYAGTFALGVRATVDVGAAMREPR
jgi:hypothetical protein